MVIGGWVPGKGRREGELGALLVGYYDDGELKYAGKVGTGLRRHGPAAAARAARAARDRRSPFDGRQPEKGAIFVKPELVAELEFSEWTQAGTLRHPSYKGLRDDKPAARRGPRGAGERRDECPKLEIFRRTLAAFDRREAALLAGELPRGLRADHVGDLARGRPRHRRRGRVKYLGRHGAVESRADAEEVEASEIAPDKS